jgi:RNA polymerase sigma-70 factor, ECF subfamily
MLLALELGGEDDEDLERRLQSRERRAMADLYDRYGRLAFSVILAVVRDTAVAEDLLQETFLRVWTRVQALERGRATLGPWLVAIARNRAIDHVRSVRSRTGRHSFGFDAGEDPSLFADIGREVFNPAHARLIRQALSKLNANQQRVIELAYYEGFSQTEIAQRMGQPIGIVKTWVRTALDSLRNELGGAETR